MSVLPRVTSLTRERLARDFDDRGPDVCHLEIRTALESENPELLDIAERWARDVGNPARMMSGFFMFYGLLRSESRATNTAAMPSTPPGAEFASLPRVSAETRAQIVKRIDAIGPESFTRAAVSELESGNPELLIMAHNFAEEQPDYGGVMQGFALIYACLSEQTERRQLLH
jgi:hypothetical protein